MDNKNFFESWMDTQNQLVKNWAETSQNLQKEWLGGQAVEKGSELYQQWMNSQLDAWRGFANSAPKAENVSGENPANDIFRQWQDWQANAAKTWTENTQEFMKAYIQKTEEGMKAFQNGNNAAFNPSNLFNSWTNQWTNAFQGGSQVWNNDTLKQAFQNMTQNTAVYGNLMNLWNDWVNGLKEGKTPEQIWKSVDFNTYKKVLDQVFGIDMAETSRSFFNQTAQMTEGFHQLTQRTGKQFMDTLTREGRVMSKLLPLDQQAYFEMYDNLNRYARKAISPFFKLNRGSETAEAEQLLDMTDKYALLMMKGAELQYCLYASGVKAMEKLFENLQDKMKNNEEVSSFQSFFTEWANTNEKIYTELFNTEDYSKLQGELLKLDVEIRQSAERLMETYLEPFPIVTRRELDEVYQTNYELRKRVRSLEKEIAEIRKSFNNEVTANIQQEAAVEIAADTIADTASEARKAANRPIKKN